MDSFALRRRLEVLERHLRGDSGGIGVSLVPCLAALGGACRTVVLVGGMVMDLQARPTGSSDVQCGGSVPGRIVQTAGGVARNVGESLARLLTNAGAASTQLPLLVSAVGDDLAGQALLQHWRMLGLSTDAIRIVPGCATPVVAVVFDRAGEVAACVADVALLESALTPTIFAESALIAASLASASLVLLDGNLSPAALEAACSLKHQTQPGGSSDNSSNSSSGRQRRIWFEPVSVPKAERVTSVLHRLDFISPNAAELAAMAAAARRRQPQRQCSSSNDSIAGSSASARSSRSTGPHVRYGSSSAAPSADTGTQPGATAGGAAALISNLLPDICVLLAAGVGHIVLTLGDHGAALCRLMPVQRQVAVMHVPALPAAVVNCSGAGDCLVAGCLYALSRGSTTEHALSYGVAAAKAAVESSSNVPAALEAAALERDAAAAAAAASRFAFPITET